MKWTSNLFKVCIAALLLAIVVKPVVGSLIRNVVYLHYARWMIQVSLIEEAALWSDPLTYDSFFLRPGIEKMNSVLVKELLGWRIVLDRENPQWDYVLAYTKLAQGDVTSAQAAFEYYLTKTDDETGTFHFIVGATDVLIGQSGRAIQIWRQEPKTAHFFLRAGSEELYKKDNLEEARQYYALAVEVTPMLCEPLYRLGVTLIELEKPDQALNIWTDVETLLCPDTFFLGEIFYHRGRLLSQVDKVEEAIVDARRSLDFDQKDVKRLVLLGNLLVKDGVIGDEARLLYMRALDINPENVWIYVGLCDFERQQGNYTQALDWCLMAVERFPEDAIVYHYTGLTYVTMKDFSQGVVWFKKALAHDSLNVNTWLRLGEGYQESGDFERSLASFQRASQIDPENEYIEQRLRGLEAK